jgi:hypothetical protein
MYGKGLMFTLHGAVASLVVIDNPADNAQQFLGTMAECLDVDFVRSA